MEQPTDKLAELDMDEAALNQQLEEARAKVRELHAPSDYRALLDVDLSQQAEAELERWTARVSRLDAGIKALAGEREAEIVRRDMEAHKATARSINADLESKEVIAVKLLAALKEAAKWTELLACKDQDILAKMDYNVANPAALTPQGWLLAGTTERLRNWGYSEQLAINEFKRLMLGHQPGAILETLKHYHAQAETEWIAWSIFTRHKKRVEAAELAAKKKAAQAVVKPARPGLPASPIADADLPSAYRANKPPARVHVGV